MTNAWDCSSPFRQICIRNFWFCRCQFRCLVYTSKVWAGLTWLYPEDHPGKCSVSPSGYLLQPDLDLPRFATPSEQVSASLALLFRIFSWSRSYSRGRSGCHLYRRNLPGLQIQTQYLFQLQNLAGKSWTRIWNGRFWRPFFPWRLRSLFLISFSISRCRPLFLFRLIPGSFGFANSRYQILGSCLECSFHCRYHRSLKRVYQIAVSSLDARTPIAE